MFIEREKYQRTCNHTMYNQCKSSLMYMHVISLKIFEHKKSTEF